jgi:hypothetical protein
MPDAKSRSEWTADDYRSHTETARRNARFKSAEDRIKRIVDAAPPLTDEQRRRLAAILCDSAGGSDAPAA